MTNISSQKNENLRTKSSIADFILMKGYNKAPFQKIFEWGQNAGNSHMKKTGAP
jgi:hypothetical protein